MPHSASYNLNTLQRLGDLCRYPCHDIVTTDKEFIFIPVNNSGKLFFTGLGAESTPIGFFISQDRGGLTLDVKCEIQVEGGYQTQRH